MENGIFRNHSLQVPTVPRFDEQSVYKQTFTLTCICQLAFYTFQIVFFKHLLPNATYLYFHANCYSHYWKTTRLLQKET